MKSKIYSLLIVLGVYAVAAAGAIVFAWLLKPYFYDPNHIQSLNYKGLSPFFGGLLLILAADIVATLIVFFFSLIFKNASVYDPYWSVAPPLIVAGFYLVTGAIFNPLHLFILIPLAFWAVRLTYNWCREFKNLKWQDWRYTRYKESFPKIYILINLTGIMLMPTLLVFAGTIPLYYLLLGKPDAAALIVGSAVVLFAAVYQAVADCQMRKFRKHPDNAGKCIDNGLWRYSRHPNYFGEIAIWFGVFIAALPNFGWLSPIGCLTILLLFVFISVPLMEGKMLKKHPRYREYQKKVRSALIPFWRAKTDGK